MNHYSAQKAYSEGLLMEKQGKYISALECYSAALAYDERFVPAFIKRGTLRIVLWHDYRGAYYDFSNAIKYNEIPDASFYFLRAKCHIHLKNKEDALTDLHKAEKINPVRDSISFYKAELYCYSFNNYEAAVEQYKLTLNKNKNMEDAWFGKGISEYKLGHYKEAVNDFNEAIHLDSNDSRFYYYRAYSQIGIKDTTQACNDWNTAYSKGFYEAKEPLSKVCKNSK